VRVALVSEPTSGTRGTLNAVVRFNFVFGRRLKQMPELPEVERLRRSLVPHLVGRTVASAVLLRRDVCEGFRSSRDGGVVRVRCGSRHLLMGGTIVELRRHGKQMAIVTDDGRALCVHLGMSGQVLWQAGTPGEHRTHVHAEWKVRLQDNGPGLGRLLFRDPRRFGGLWAYDTVQALEAHRWSRLGPDALEVTGEQLRDALRGTPRTIKAALLDQRVTAGVGNIYADEALFIAGLRPRRRAGLLGAADLTRLADAVRGVLARSIQTGGSTLRDYVDANGEAGHSQLEHAVYGRGGLACLECGKALRRGCVAQRTTVWCSGCQR